MIRPRVPAPKPLSARAAVFARDTHQQELEKTADRNRAFMKGYDAGIAAVTEPVAKASKVKTDQVAAYDADGNLIGVVDPSDITLIAPAKAPDKPQASAQPAPAQQPAAAPADDAVPAAKAMSLGAGKAGQHQLGGKKPGPAAGVPVAPAEPIEDDEDDEVLAKTRAGDFRGAALLLKARLDSSYDAPEQATAANTLQMLAVAELSKIQQRR